MFLAKVISNLNPKSAIWKKGKILQNLKVVLGEKSFHVCVMLLLWSISYKNS